MTALPLSFAPAPRIATEEEPVPTRVAPQEVAHTSVEDTVMLPRHIADAAYHLLKAVHALKDNGHHELFLALGKALNTGKDRVEPEHAQPCASCHVQVGQGFAHHPECWSDEAVYYRSVPIPQLHPEDD